jgi:hypothetical protein
MATMELASIPREFPQFGRHLTSLVRPASEVFGQQGARNRCCQGQGLTDSPDWGDGDGLDCQCADSPNDVVILDAVEVSETRNVCCLPVKIALVVDKSGRKLDRVNGLVSKRKVEVSFEYRWIEWQKDSACETECWEAVARGYDPPSGNSPKVESGVWNPSHTDHPHGKAENERGAKRHKKSLEAAKSDEFFDEPSDPPGGLFELSDVPWGGAGGRKVNILVGAKSDCGAACLWMRYHYDGADIDIEVRDVSFDKDCGQVTLSEKKGREARPPYFPELFDMEYWKTLPRQAGTETWSHPFKSPARR